MKVTAKEFNEDYQPTVHMEFYTKGLNATFDKDVELLTLDVPAFAFDGPVLTENTRKALIDAGLTMRQIDEALEEMMDNLQCKVLAAMLLKRRV
jgi:hypothetical protein